MTVSQPQLPRWQHIDAASREYKLSISWYLFHVEDAIVAREHICIAFAMCIVQQSRSRYRLYVLRGRLHSSTVCMARSDLRDAFVVWLCKSETIEDHVLYYAKVVSRCTR